MSGLVALVGGGEHTPGCEDTDRLLLSESGSRRPRVAVILAASPQRRRAFKRAEAEQWWARLGARARCAFAGEADPHRVAAALLRAADLVVLTGGRPWLLGRRLEEAELGHRLRERWHAGVPIMGSSAGAMMLAEAAWSLKPSAPLRVRRALGLVPGALVAPHAGRHGIDTWAALTQRAHPELEVLVIPDRAALLLGREPAAVGLGGARTAATAMKSASPSCGR